MILSILLIEFDWYIFMIVYGENMLENMCFYYFQVVDVLKGYYEVDEGNSIFLDDFLINGKFYSCFEVMGNFLFIIFEEWDGQLIYEIILGFLELICIIGDIMFEGEEILLVNGYCIMV